MIDLIVVIILVLLFGWAISYMVRAKKEGVKCIGCPDAKSCSQKCSSCSGGYPGGCSSDCSGSCPGDCPGNCQNTPDK